MLLLKVSVSGVSCLMSYLILVVHTVYCIVILCRDYTDRTVFSSYQSRSVWSVAVSESLSCQDTVAQHTPLHTTPHSTVVTVTVKLPPSLYNNRI